MEIELLHSEVVDVSNNIFYFGTYIKGKEKPLVVYAMVNMNLSAEKQDADIVFCVEELILKVNTLKSNC